MYAGGISGIYGIFLNSLWYIFKLSNDDQKEKRTFY